MFNCHLYPRDIYYDITTRPLSEYYVVYSFTRKPRLRGRDGLCFSLPTDLSESLGEDRYGMKCSIVAFELVPNVNPRPWAFCSSIRSLGRQDCVNIPKAFHRDFATGSEWIVFLVKSYWPEQSADYRDYAEMRYRDITGDDYDFGKWFVR